MTSLSRESTRGQLGWLSAGRISTPGGLEEKPAAKWGNGSWEMSQRDLLPCLGSKTHISSHQVVKEPCIRSAISDYLAQQSLTPVPGRTEPVGNSSHPRRRLLWRRTDSRMKMARDEDRLHGKMQINAVKPQN